jgi:opine dehydrogenase
MYACRISGPARVEIHGIKLRVPVAAFPASDTPRVLELAEQLYPEFTPASNVLETSLDNIGAVLHPGTVILNTNRIEAGKDFDFYRGMTPTVTHFLEMIDAERLAVAEVFGVQLDSAREWLRKTYDGVEGETLYECIQSNVAYHGIKAPKSLHVRYIYEDVPTGLVPLTSLGAVAGVATPTCRSLVDIACALFDRNFWQEGRTVEKLGLAGMTVAEIIDLVDQS